MANNLTNTSSPLTNPLQNNNAAMVAIGYLAGIAAVKLPIFDMMTWNYIFMSIGGVIVTAVPFILNRKQAVMTATANFAEVNKIELDKNVPGAVELADSTPKEVVAK